MLVLSRKSGEAIRIGDDIEVSIIDVRGDTVRIGITAPRNVAIFRMELLEEVAKTNIDAVRTTSVKLDVLNALLSEKRKTEQNNGGGRE